MIELHIMMLFKKFYPTIVEPIAETKNPKEIS